MPHPRRASILASLASVALAAILVVGAGGAIAQEASPTAETEVAPSPTPLPPPVRSFLEAEALVESLPAGPATINMSAIVIAPRVALRATVTNGPVLILVESGTLTIDADAALIGLPPSGQSTGLMPDATPAPAPVASVEVLEDNQVLLPAGTRVQLRNTTDEDVDLTIVAIAPEGEPPFGQPAS
jgi:hypothetical protein